MSEILVLLEQTIFKMRNILTIIVITSFLSCEKNEGITLNDSELIIGKWKLVESSYSIGGPLITEVVEDGHEITFSNNLTFTSSASPECINGTYRINENDTLWYSELTLQYECIRVNSPINIITYAINFTSQDQFILVPKSVTCIEGCSYKYQKQ